MNSLLRIAAIVPELRVGDIEFNTKEIIFSKLVGINFNVIQIEGLYIRAQKLAHN